MRLCALKRKSTIKCCNVLEKYIKIWMMTVYNETCMSFHYDQSFIKNLLFALFINSFCTWIYGLHDFYGKQVGKLHLDWLYFLLSGIFSLHLTSHHWRSLFFLLCESRTPSSQELSCPIKLDQISISLLIITVKIIFSYGILSETHNPNQFCA